MFTMYLDFRFSTPIPQGMSEDQFKKDFVKSGWKIEQDHGNGELLLSMELNRFTNEFVDFRGFLRRHFGKLDPQAVTIDNISLVTERPIANEPARGEFFGKKFGKKTFLMLNFYEKETAIELHGLSPETFSVAASYFGLCAEQFCTLTTLHELCNQTMSLAEFQRTSRGIYRNLFLMEQEIAHGLKTLVGRKAWKSYEEPPKPFTKEEIDRHHDEELFKLLTHAVALNRKG